MNPYSVVHSFEEAVAEYAGSKYAVAVESCTAAIFLSLMWVGVKGKWVSIPKFTYPGVACSIIHAGGKINFTDDDWQGAYELYPFKIVDSALRFKRGMFEGEYYCLSFHIRKHIPLGRGGMILTDNKDAYEWLKLARFDGREPKPLQEQKEFTVLGYNMYMEPSTAARGIQLIQALGDKYLADLKTEDQKYTDLSNFKIFTDAT